MVPEVSGGSTVPRRSLGREMLALRGKAKLNATEAAQLINFSRQKLWKIERGEIAVNPNDAKQMCDVYGASSELSETLIALARETKARGWWQSYSDVVSEKFAVYVGLEAAASNLQQYAIELVPGLLQTEDYARDLIVTDLPDASPKEIERRLEARMTRRWVLRRENPLPLNILLNESVLRRPIASGTIMAAQLRHLAEASEAPTTSIRVVPFTAGTHRGVISGQFVLLKFPPGLAPNPEPPTIYVEGYTGALYLDKADEIGRFEGAFADIASKALDLDRSRDLIHKAAKEMHGQ